VNIEKASYLCNLQEHNNEGIIKEASLFLSPLNKNRSWTSSPTNLADYNELVLYLHRVGLLDKDTIGCD